MPITLTTIAGRPAALIRDYKGQEHAYFFTLQDSGSVLLEPVESEGLTRYRCAPWTREMWSCTCRDWLCRWQALGECCKHGDAARELTAVFGAARKEEAS